MKKGTENENQSFNEEQKNIGNDQVAKILAEMQDKINKLEADKATAFQVPIGMDADAIAKIVAAAVNTRDKDLNYQAGIKQEDIPADDYLEEGVRFSAPTGGYVIVDDSRKGHRVLLPYNKDAIIFEHFATRKIQQGKYKITAPFCVYVSKSKKEIEWLRNHSLYNTMFYENATQALGVDVMKMQKLARIMTFVQTYSMHDLIQRCKEHGIAIGEDYQTMRSNLAWAMVEMEMRSEQSASERALADSAKASMLLASKPH